MVLKLLGIGKKSEYFLEAPPSSNGASSGKAPAPAEEPVKPAEAAPAPAAPEATTNGSAAPAAAPAQPAAKKVKKTKTEAPSAAAPAQPVAAQPVAKAAPEIKNFATNGLMPMNTPRRRPGPSLAMFKDMARDVTPRK